LTNQGLRPDLIAAKDLTSSHEAGGSGNIPYDSIERVEQFLFFFLAAAPSRGARKIVESHRTLERGRNWTQKSPQGVIIARKLTGTPGRENDLR
jgi:hypothetical protein